MIRYEYTGREKELLTSLLHYRNHEYDAEQGRFLTEDPAGMAGGLNRYSYVANDPLGFNDPFGLSLATFLIGQMLGETIGGLMGGAAAKSAMRGGRARDFLRDETGGCV